MSYFVLAQESAPVAVQTTENVTIEVPAGGEVAVAEQQGSNPFMGMLPIILIMVLFMFFMSRSSKKQAARRQEALSKIMKGDRVVTNAGIFGVISEVKEESFMVEIAPNVKIEITKAGVSSAVPTEEKAIEKQDK